MIKLVGLAVVFSLFFAFYFDPCSFVRLGFQPPRAAAAAADRSQL